MNGQLYFEQEPWHRALRCIEEQQLGPVVTLSVQGVCPKGTLDDAAGKWKDRLPALLGPSASQEELRCGTALLYLGRHENGAIVRLFFDDSREDLCENFEIVTEKALLQWKPGTQPQGHMLGDGAHFCDCAQPYPVELEVR